MEHAPGPRGSPQAPHGPGALISRELPLACAANTEWRFSSAVLRHDGHSGVSDPRRSCSNSFEQLLHRYSNSGIYISYRVARDAS